MKKCLVQFALNPIFRLIPCTQTFNFHLFFLYIEKNLPTLLFGGDAPALGVDLDSTPGDAEDGEAEAPKQ